MSDSEYSSYQATYCEGCGKLAEASDHLREMVSEPVHRVDLITAIGDIEEVGETTAMETGACDDCGGQLVHRVYVHPADNVPEPEYDPEPSEIAGRDPDEDALIALSADPEEQDWQEAREVSWLTEGDE